MNRIVRITALAVALALAAPHAVVAGTTDTKTAKTCYFVRNHLPCPCPKAKDARAVMNAARFTVGALGSAIGTTAVALSRADGNHAAPRKSGDSRKP